MSPDEVEALAAAHIQICADALRVQSVAQAVQCLDEVLELYEQNSAAVHDSAMRGLLLFIRWANRIANSDAHMCALAALEDRVNRLANGPH